MLYYFGFCLLCLVIFIFGHWFDGDNLKLLDLFGMTLIALAPMMNVICLVGTVFHLIVKVIYVHNDGVLLKGRGK